MRLVQVAAGVAAGVLAFALGALIFRIQEADEVKRALSGEVPTMSRRPFPGFHDEAGLIGKIAVLWIVLLILIGLLILDGISIGLTTFKLSNTAQAAATTAAANFKNFARRAGCLHGGADRPDERATCPSRTGPRVVQDQRAQRGRRLITLHASASSLVLGRLSFTKDFTKITAKETAEPSTL